MMRKSRVLKKLRSGGVVSCLKVNLDAQATEIAGISGFDCVWIDREHLADDWSSLRSHIWAAKSNDMDIVVRTTRGCYSNYIKPLELDASGVMIPHVMNLEDAKSIVKMTRFQPLGLRAVDGGNADGKYTMLDPNEYVKQANNERFVILQIEDPEPLEDLEEIAKLEGIDMLFFGPGDFSHAIGDLGNWENPRIIEARKNIAEVCIRNNKFAGTVGSINNLEELIGLGYKFISLGADVVGHANYCRQIINDFSNKT
ncbi:HpcH/HpaI aldolase family protein [Arenibacter latericius]|uniref:HpcH/HpaI aldolase family protein n=1 Tax=Arenibacter latericius TaxID=86104 RepID=UPI00055985B9|nr:aldolase/citrate lyase family protein [Arenibacter latericius]